MTEVVLDPGPLPVGPYDRKGAAWWGVLCLIVTEAALFGCLFFGYYYFDFQLPHSWRPTSPPSFNWSGPATVAVLGSAATIWLSERAIRRGAPWASLLWTLITFLLGAVFIWLQVEDWLTKPFRPQTSPYGSFYFTITGLHVLHTLAGLLGLLFVSLWTFLGYFNRPRSSAISNMAAYWWFVVGLWVAVFVTFFVTPYLW